DIPEPCEPGFALAAGLGQASAVRKMRNERAAVGDLVDLLLAPTQHPAPRRQAIDQVRRSGRGRHRGAEVAATADEQPEERLRAGDEAGISGGGCQPYRLLDQGEGMLRILETTQRASEQPQPA